MATRAITPQLDASVFDRVIAIDLRGVFLCTKYELREMAIGKSMAEEAPSWHQTTIVSDTLRVFGNTAWDLGTFSTQGPEGNLAVSRYLVVLRRGMQEWKISSLAVVPETPVTATR
jgi:hypothetical protein